MKQLKRISLLVSIMTLIFCSTKVQSDSTKKIKSPAQPKNSVDTVDYQSVAEFKTLSRKKEFRVGELISIDVALLNKSKESTYFLDLENWGRISVFDSAHKKIAIRGGSVCAFRARTFNLLGSGEYDSSFFIYLIGCDDMYKHNSSDWKSMEDDFNKGRFVNIGYRCIDTKKPGKYLIKAEISNGFSESSGYPQKDKTKKTAVGTIESTPFEITIIEDSQK
jgi:hypothetical protein